jgi:hypothetical protein
MANSWYEIQALFFLYVVVSSTVLLIKNIIMEKDLEQKIKDLKKFIELKTDLGVANYLGKELREICGMVETMTKEGIE